MKTFGDYLKANIQHLIGNVAEIFEPEDFEQAVHDAAYEIARAQGQASAVHIRREIEPRTGFRWVLIAVDEKQIWLTPRDFRLLRAIILAFDHDKPPQIGETLVVPYMPDIGPMKFTWDQELQDRLNTRDGQPEEEAEQ